MNNLVTESDLTFLLNISLIVAKDLGFIKTDQYGRWAIGLDKSGNLEKKIFGAELLCAIVFTK
jgi:hypothetical protein